LKHLNQAARFPRANDQTVFWKDKYTNRTLGQHQAQINPAKLQS